MYRLSVEVLSALQTVALSMLRLGDGEGAAGLHAWACRAFEPQLALLQRSRSAALLRRQIEASSGSSKAPLPAEEVEEDLPFGAPASSSSDPNRGGKAEAGAKQKQAADPSASGGGAGASSCPGLEWLLGVALQAQGRCANRATSALLPFFHFVCLNC